MNQKNDGKSKTSSDRLVDGALEILLCSYKLVREGLKTKYYKFSENIYLMLSLAALSIITIYKDQHLQLVRLIPISIFQEPLAKLLDNIGFIWLSILVVLAIFIFTSMCAGLRTYKLHRKYQRALDHLSLTTGLGHSPKVVNVDADNDQRTIIRVDSTGIGQERYKTKLDDLRCAAGQVVESVDYWKPDNRYIEISLAKKLLEHHANYVDLVEHLKRPYSFIVGKSMQGVITENLEDVPHYAIAGSTNGGKSVAFKNIILGLLESSKRIQMYIFDFKKVEVNEFKELSNVTLVKEEQVAAQMLEEFVKEMNERYKKLEAMNAKKIDPERDDLDRIVIAIDEAFDLLGKVPRNDPKYKNVETARKCLSELSRKARAAGIHLIFATQKVDKNSIDTQIQENLEGRLSFRMNTIENSVRLLQNNMSYYLPSIPGRAIWKKGANYTEVQCPFISDEELVQRINVLKNNQGSNEVKMIDVVQPQEKSSEQLSEYSQGNAI